MKEETYKKARQLKVEIDTCLREIEVTNDLLDLLQKEQVYYELRFCPSANYEGPSWSNRIVELDSECVEDILNRKLENLTKSLAKAESDFKAL